jgi:hypothetical protein
VQLIRALAALVVAVALLAGCAPTSGAAAVVDGEPISEAQLADTVTQLRAFSDVPARGVLQALIVSPFWVEAAGDIGVGASIDDARERLDALAADAGGEQASPEWGPGMLLIARVLVAQDRATQTGLGEELASAANGLVREADIEVDPRYGEWTSEGVTPTTPEWLIQPSVPTE